MDEHPARPGPAGQDRGWDALGQGRGGGHDNFADAIGLGQSADRSAADQ